MQKGGKKMTEDKSVSRATHKKSLYGFKLSAEASVGGVRLELTDCIGIREFCDSRVTLVTKRGRIEILGDKLSVTIYENRTVELFGCITDIKLCISGKRKGEFSGED